MIDIEELRYLGRRLERQPLLDAADEIERLRKLLQRAAREIRSTNDGNGFLAKEIEDAIEEA
jgi:hypothetical protein